MGALFTGGLKRLQARYPQIGDIRGPGLFIGVEMVKDPETKEPASDEAKAVVAQAWRRGVILATASALPNVIKIKPPLIIGEAEVGAVLDVFADCLKAVYS
jgi:4-aminobutyrate aminotransferase-like enzyme